MSAFGDTPFIFLLVFVINKINGGTTSGSSIAPYTLADFTKDSRIYDMAIRICVGEAEEWFNETFPNGASSLALRGVCSL